MACHMYTLCILYTILYTLIGRYAQNLVPLITWQPFGLLTWNFARVMSLMRRTFTVSFVVIALLLREICTPAPRTARNLKIAIAQEPLWRQSWYLAKSVVTLRCCYVVSYKFVALLRGELLLSARFGPCLVCSGTTRPRPFKLGTRRELNRKNILCELQVCTVNGSPSRVQNVLTPKLYLSALLPKGGAQCPETLPDDGPW